LDNGSGEDWHPAQYLVKRSSTNRPGRLLRSRQAPPARPEDAALRPAVWRWSLALLPLLCIALGGGTARWSQGIVLFLLGALLIVAPPRFSLGWKFNLVLAGLAALGLTGFLPAAWFAWPQWRSAMVDDFGFVLASTLSPQPWLTAERCLIFLGGICWFYLLATVNWSPEERLRAARIFGFGVVALAMAFLLLLKLDIAVPIWHADRHFGPFPNRNQTANFLAVGSLPVLACLQLAWRAGKRVTAIAWMVGWLIVALAAFTSFSRAGVILLFAGTAVYVALQAARATSREAGRTEGAGLRLDRFRVLALGVSLVAILLSAFLVFGGETLSRLTPSTMTSTVQAVTTEFRLRIQGDALRMIAASPWTGLGLGNFASVFPLFRVNSALPARAIHPESDWLWAAAELGWPAVVLVLAGCALLMRGLWPWRRAPDRPLRTAAAVALLVFVTHCFVDVSAHRLGTCFCVLFVMGLALRGEAPETPPFRVRARWPAVLFRLLGLALMVGGGTWIQEARGVILLPGEEGVARMESEAARAAARGDYAGVERAMDQSITWAPLDWEAYFTRAGARAYLRRDDGGAAADFQRSRYLEPFIGELPYDEARIWMSTGHAALAVNAVVEACRREPAHAGEYMDGVYTVAPHDAMFIQRMGRIARNDPLLLQPFLNELRPPESGEFIASYLKVDPDLTRLTAAQQTKFFRSWAQFGDAGDLVARLARRPDWQRQAWRWWADASAHTGAYEQACGIVARFAPPPAVPALEEVETMPRTELEQEAAAAPGDAALALRLYAAEKKAGNGSAALAAVRRIAAVPGAPAYFHYLEATAAAETGDWEGSWNAWQEYLNAENVQG
jgi:O-antigen ligase